jgi:uncharacterized protein (TIGR02145 family)
MLEISINELNENTVYYVRAFATNSQGTAVGNMISFKTLDFPNPVVSSSPVVSISQTSAIAGGEVIKEGGSPVTERGICWSTSSNPSISSSRILAGSGLGKFTVELTELLPQTTYYVKAYAINSTLTSYGEEVVFTTAPTETSVIDIENNVYNIIQIGTQTWLKENLLTTKYNDGTSIPLITDDNTWSEIRTAAYCWYNNDEDNNKNTYGALYNWYTINSGNLCPTGWHVPTDAEFVALVNYLGGSLVAGGKLKESGTAHWISPNTDATNESGFSGLPAGGRDILGRFSSIGLSGGFWTSSENNNSAYDQSLSYDTGNSRRLSPFKWYGASVRCIKD